MNELPVGRRVAQWRVRRNMTQQQFADRLGKSKSWVDKIERGVRPLERVSNLREVAETLRIDVEVLLATRPVRATPVVAGVDGVRTALARYHLPGADRSPLVEELAARLEHAEQSYRHARYPALLALLPGLLDAVRGAHAARPGATDALLVSVYALIALALVKVDQGELAWLAADRGMTVALANHDTHLAAVATVSLSQALRSRGRRRSALEAALAAADRVGAPGGRTSAGVALRGTLLLQAALAAAGGGDERVTRQSLDQAATIARDIDPDGGSGGGAAVEVHDRPAVRKLVAVVWRSADAPAGLAQLAATFHVG
ncbi:helix-turn-helix domain-containing protein [Micromonospora ureilytica]|uniref:helix-turn-helix domain-containing protein n=1 Tax=Micromonospora ureilytica TaxID=709868 RepID=UPI00403A2F1C